jgi:hypothetical protein
LCSKGFPLSYHFPIPPRYSIDIGSSKREKRGQKKRKERECWEVEGGFAELKLFLMLF